LGLALTIAGLFCGLFVVQWLGIDVGIWFGPCGFQQRYGLPCPTCGMTTATLAFARGKVIRAILIQPAAGLICLGLMVTGLVSAGCALTGRIPRRLLKARYLARARYLVSALVIWILAVWLIRLLAIWA